MGRPILAFAIAPLWVRLVVAPYAAVFLFPYAAQVHWVVITAFISAFFSYLGTFAIGRPAYCVLRARQVSSIWVGIGLGFVTGGAMSLVFLLCFGLFLGSRVTDMVNRFLADWLQHLLVLVVTGTLGVLVGVTVWLIARPPLSHRLKA